MKNILLIGGAGYVGSVVSSHFLKQGYKVSVLDYFVYNNQPSVSCFIGDSNYRLFYGDINDEKILEKASAGITDVILLAGLVGDPITKKYPKEAQLINEIGIQKCIDYFIGKGLDKLVFISTCSNYGLIKEGELADENFPLNPLSLYAKAKVANEEYLIQKANKVDYTGVVLRFSTAFGLSPRMRFDLSISEFVRDLYFGEELLVYDENTWRPYCHVRDFARLLDTVINSDKEKVAFEIFNAGGDINNFTKKMIVEEILNHLPNSNIKYGTNGNDARNYRVSFSKIQNSLGFEPDFSVKDGITEMIEALNLGLFRDSLEHKYRYGNYKI